MTDVFIEVICNVLNKKHLLSRPYPWRPESFRDNEAISLQTIFF